MVIILIISLICFIICFFLGSLNLLVGTKLIKTREKLSPFECGFSPNKKSRRPFSLRFFIITILFLIFDVEIILILPLGILVKKSTQTEITYTGFILTFILILGLIYEWSQNSLNWYI